MAERNEAPEAATPFEEHELYQAAMDDLAAGRESDGADKLRRLIALYPGEQALRDLLVRIELKASLVNTGRVRPTFARPTPFLRGTLLILFAIALTLMVFALFFWILGEGYLDAGLTPTPSPAEDAQRCQELEDAGDLTGARDCWQGLLNQNPANSEAAAGLARVAVMDELKPLCREAIGARDGGDLQRAQDLFAQICGQVQNLPERDRVFYDCNCREQIQLIEKRTQLGDLWQQAQDCFGAGDLMCGIDRLKSVRESDPTYRASEVGDLLYQAYVRLADPLLQTGGECEALRQAVVYMGLALEERPGDQALYNERQLAYRYVQGCDAASDGDWPAAVDWWQRVYDEDPNYADRMLESRLRQAYPLACEMLVERANGELDDAIDCYEQAQKIIRGDEALEQELFLATEYMAGAEAFSRENWSVAIQRWGPIYTIRPDYQNGLLEANLRQACLNDPEPDAELCPP
jgi:tetratricopeptide (TPR) repeat protein